ncbi:hypothetical protein PV569_33690 [Streptomyces scabiei]|uniref:hypothetical protein n=1 Tax=Streptomyces scabiei TaxID=1930 RepID=UPI0029A9A505|nr:hypothetical protein [Streptomyces scabiei]MDX3298617.1 hypothetical protein [Streptomyces scabiei]
MADEPCPSARPNLDYNRLVEAINALPAQPTVPRHPDKERREQYADLIRTRIKTLTLPSPYPGAAPTFGATEYDIADVVLAAHDAETDRDDELAQLRAERNAALRLAAVWADAPDPLVRASAADLHSAIRGARPTHKMLARLLDCGLCYEENGQEIHPHPECTATTPPPPELRDVITAAIRERRNTGRGYVDCECGSCAVSTGPCHCEPAHCPSAPHDGPEADADAVLQALEHHLTITDADAWCKKCLRVWEHRHHQCDDIPALDEARAERNRLQRAIDAIRHFNKLTTGSCRVQAAEHAQDNLDLLNRSLNPPAPHDPNKAAP